MKLVVAALAVFLVATPAAAASADWVLNFRRCQAERHFTLPESEFPIADNRVVAVIDSGEIDELEKAAAFLKECQKFWTCVSERNAGKKKHCYNPKWAPRP